MSTVHDEEREKDQILITLEGKPKWYYRFPFFPRIIHHKGLRMVTVCWRDCSCVERSVGKPHFFDLLIATGKSPWYKKVSGVQIWYWSPALPPTSRGEGDYFKRIETSVKNGGIIYLIDIIAQNWLLILLSNTWNTLNLIILKSFILLMKFESTFRNKFNNLQEIQSDSDTNFECRDTYLSIRT